MKKVRCFLAIVALAATLGGVSLQSTGAGLMANAAARQHPHSISSTSSAKPMALKIYDPCPSGGTNDC